MLHADTREWGGGGGGEGLAHLPSPPRNNEERGTTLAWPVKLQKLNYFTHPTMHNVDMVSF